MVTLWILLKILSQKKRLKRSIRTILFHYFSPVAMAADTVSFDFRPDTITFGSSLPDVVTLGADTGTDTLNIGYGSHVPGGMGEDHINFSTGVAGTQYDDSKYYEDVHGLVAGELPDDKDDK